MRVKIFKALIAGEPRLHGRDLDADRGPKLTTVLGVAEAALDAAKDHAAGSAPPRQLAGHRSSGCWCSRSLFAVGMMMLVSRRVTGPLLDDPGAMHKLAGGDMSAEVSFGERKDEIGALGSATQAFKSSMVEAERLRAEQKETEGARRGAAQGRRCASSPTNSRPRSATSSVRCRARRASSKRPRAR